MNTHKIEQFLKDQVRVAVAVSGGPDSMALAWLLARQDVEVHALHVDHGLRDGSAAEAARIKAQLSDAAFFALTWEGEKPEARVQEEARKARYALMVEHCKAHGIAHLFLAHHQDDQAETVLFRLAKGSGLDGLAGMRAAQEYGGVTLCRPLLDVPKEELIAICEDNGLEYLQDPSNESEDFARVRLRNARAVLEEEGLSNKRLATTAMRLARARQALDEIAAAVYDEALKEKNTQHIVLNFKALKGKGEEILLRVILKSMQTLRPEKDYAPRMEKLEALVGDLLQNEKFQKRTLGGVIFECDDAQDVLILSKE